MGSTLRSFKSSLRGSLFIAVVLCFTGSVKASDDFLGRFLTRYPRELVGDARERADEKVKILEDSPIIHEFDLTPLWDNEEWRVELGATFSDVGCINLRFCHNPGKEWTDENPCVRVRVYDSTRSAISDTLALASCIQTRPSPLIVFSGIGDFAVQHPHGAEHLSFARRNVGIHMSRFGPFSTEKVAEEIDALLIATLEEVDRLAQADASGTTKPRERDRGVFNRREKSLLRRVFHDYVLRSLQERDIHKELDWIEKEALGKSGYQNARDSVLSLALRPKQEVEALALKILRMSSDSGCCHNAALVLAYHGNDVVEDQLERTAVGSDIALMTSSGFERGEAAFGLLMLGKKLPENFSIATANSSIFEGLDILLERMPSSKEDVFRIICPPRGNESSAD